MCHELRAIFLLCAVGLATGKLESTARAAVPSDWGKTVVGIRLDSDAHLNLREFEGQITQKVGEPLDSSTVTESLKRLYATGRFLDLRADVESQESGVELVFVARAVFFSGLVQVAGAPKSVDPKILADASRLRLGLPLAEDDLAEASRRLVAVLDDHGYHEARIEHQLIRHLDTQEVDVRFSVAPGPAAGLARVEFEGRTLVPPESLAPIAGWRAGRPLTSAGIERGLLKVHKFYVDRGRLQATANVEARIYDPASRTDTLRVRVEAGPLVRVRVEGASLSKPKLAELLPVFRDGVVDEDSLERGERNLEDYFERQGYFSAVAKAGRADHTGPEEIDVAYRVTLGVREEFAAYTFHGNSSIGAAELAAAIADDQNGPSRNVFSKELAARHLETLQATYRARGFLEAHVTLRLDHRTEFQPGRLLVAFEVEEGSQTKVGRLVLRGLDQKQQNDLWPLLLAKPEQPFSPERAEADRDRILAYFAEHGYTRATVSWQASPVSPAHQVDLEYQAEPGLQERIRKVVILGNQETRAGIVRRELTLREGEPLRQRDMHESQHRLYDLGIFNQVQITKQDTQSPQSEDTVLVSVDEARRWTLGYGGGLEVQRLGGNQPQGQLKASPRLSLDLSRLNVGGRAQTFTLRGQLSNLEEGGGLSYQIPRLAAQRDLTLRLNGLVDRSRDVLTFTADRREASLTVEKRLSPATVLAGRYSFRRVQALDISTRISPEQIPLFSRAARVGALGAGYVGDRRDDPADATAGSYFLADASVAWHRFGSEANFLRFSGQNSTYRRLSAHLIFARSTRFGVETPFGRPTAISVPGGGLVLEPAIPLPERFFMGGSESHRGFSINQAGPRDPGTGFPLGGNALFFNSLELRAPFAEKRLGLVFFEDAGNVFSTIRKMRLLKFTQSGPTDSDYNVNAVGLGVRYKTPVAPVRFDVGYALNPPEFQVQISNGPLLPPTLEVRRLSRFQFFLSIGQSF